MTATTSRTRPGRNTAGPGAVRPRRSTAVVTGAAGLALAVSVLAGTWVGAVPLPPGGVVLTLADRALGPFGVDVPGGLEGTQAAVLLQLRLPRVVLAVLVGAALAVSGAAYQGVFRNPLADPYLLGAAAGAGLGATLTIAYSPVQSLGPVGIVPLAAFAGALFGVFCALGLGSVAGGAHSPTLLLAGIAVAAFLAAAQNLVQQQNTDDLRQIYGWMIGQLGSSQWSDVVLVLPYLGVACAVLLCCGRALDVLAVGDDEAASLGVHPGRLRLLVILAASLATASAVAVSGLIGFVGLVVPHIVRRLAGGSYTRVLPLSLLVGGAFLVVADLIARVILAPAELPIGVVTAFIGAPFFAALLWAGARRR
ncbi:iron complex transport system permease protein [Blastococcus aurantiacus]|uniref:Iron complex transport system permease protein n=1 Tax=Blastococcus aurantiacus TaxID=1550231 RepID=A0A1G7JD00_9ACTN|nr:iron ABC transporter permease [Blastococcus aurantiacus]SDF22765.1 iron complex transport system permease protein [Blastococcus aurantiacus]